MKIAVAGVGYVGLSNAVLLSQYNHVVAFDISEERVDMVNRRISPIVDDEIERYLKEKSLILSPQRMPKKHFPMPSLLLYQLLPITTRIKAILIPPPLRAL